MRRGRGSARDALSALDQVVASGSADAARPELAAVLDALADGDVGQVLVALSALLAGGWGPQQLATELIDDLRQVFLAALAPELCTVSGPSLERFRSSPKQWVWRGWCAAWRSSVTRWSTCVRRPTRRWSSRSRAVRAVRPDLDSGMEALSERVSVLERAQSGRARLPPPGRVAGACRSRRSPLPPAPAAVAPEAPAAPRPPAEVARRPSLGAVRRSKEGPQPRCARCVRAGRPRHRRHRRPSRRRRWSPSSWPRRPR